MRAEQRAKAIYSIKLISDTIFVENTRINRQGCYIENTRSRINGKTIFLQKV